MIPGLKLKWFFFSSLNSKCHDLHSEQQYDFILIYYISINTHQEIYR